MISNNCRDISCSAIPLLLNGILLLLHPTFFRLLGDSDKTLFLEPAVQIVRRQAPQKSSVQTPDFQIAKVATGATTNDGIHMQKAIMASSIPT